MKRIFFALCIIAFAFSCSSDDNEEQVQPPNSNFYALTVGNSWVYKWYRLVDGTDEFSGVTESISIVGTEEINNETYYKFKKTIVGNPDIIPGQATLLHMEPDGDHYEFKRDSLGYLIDETGEIKFANNTNDEILIFSNFSGLENYYGQVLESSIDYSTEAGVFESLEMIFKIVNDTGEVGDGKNYHYYSDSVGLISEKNAYVMSCGDFCGFYEKRLNSFTIN